ncbi:MAG: TspO/MBR family protein [Hyphomicrobiaceae bacterium]
MRNLILKHPIIVAAAGVIVVALLGGSMTDTGPWYQALNKPSWQPPGWLFAPAWTLIFAFVALGATAAWRDVPSEGKRQGLILLLCVNALLNVAWSFLFFQMQRPDWALIEVAVFWASILALVIYTLPYSLKAALYFAPYLAWVSIAAVLNWAVVSLN